MAFNSFEFLLFLPILIIIYFTIPFSWRRWLLLVSSYIFYMFFRVEYGILLLLSTIIDFYLGKQMGVSGSKLRRRKILIISLVHNIGLLVALKYLNFIHKTIQSLFQFINISIDLQGFSLLVPVGISYYTFKKLSYLIDIYRGNQEPEKDFGYFALYVSFFPAIMSGPIDRANQLIPQFFKKHDFDYHRMTSGLKLMTWGFFKKLIIADRLAIFVNEVYGAPTQYEGLSLIVATIYFSFQIYCDFSGYTDIVRGISRIFGIELMENFNRPYFSRSIVEFWKRWHISLSNWLMDYLFLPIAYKVSGRIVQPFFLKIRAESWAYITGILITMFICGLWHGVGWNFIIWGILHGIFLSVSFMTKKTRRQLAKKFKIKKNSLFRRLIQVSITFSSVTFAWIFFRANTISDAKYIVTHIFSGWSQILNINRFWEAFHFGLLKKELAVAIASIGMMLVVQLLRKHRTFEIFLSDLIKPLRWSIYVFLLIWILTFSDAEGGTFIYFQF